MVIIIFILFEPLMLSEEALDFTYRRYHEVCALGLNDYEGS
jgi:hypothetical protein